MLNSRTADINWSIGDFPNWELEHEGEDSDSPEPEEGLKSIAESLVVLQSLRRSRQKWLTGTFPKFSSKSRGGKPAEVVPPPHTIHNRGRCDIEIGPHTFTSTTVFEVHYQYIPASKPSNVAYQPQTSSWQATTPYGTNSFNAFEPPPNEKTSTHPTPTVAQTKEAIESQKSSSTPLLSSLGSAVSITHDLISQVNSAASSNPTLATLLQLAASGKASPDQLKTLGLLIQSLAGPSTTQGSPDPPTSTSAPLQRATSQAPGGPNMSSPPAKDFDIVMEFLENPSDRWILPRSPVIIERLGENQSRSDILVTAGIPFANMPLPGIDKEKEPSATDDSVQQLATFCFVDASWDIWSCISHWAGAQDQMDTTRKAFERLLGKEPDRVYLAHQISDGPLLSQIKISTQPPYSIKSIKPTQTDPTKPKRIRKPAARKPPVDKSNPSAEQPPPTKRKKTQLKEGASLPKMACIACGASDVPLVMGGRYCRPCVAPNNITTTEVQPHGGTFIHKFWAAPQPEQVHLTQQPVPYPSIPVESQAAGPSSRAVVPQSTNVPKSKSPTQAQEVKDAPTRATRRTKSTSRDAVSASANGSLSTTSTPGREAKETPARAAKRTELTSGPDTETPTPVQESEEAPVRATKRTKSTSRPATAIPPPTQPPSTASRKKKSR